MTKTINEVAAILGITPEALQARIEAIVTLQGDISDIDFLTYDWS